LRKAVERRGRRIRAINPLLTTPHERGRFRGLVNATSRLMEPCFNVATAMGFSGGLSVEE
jgi:hypothetical protein